MPTKLSYRGPLITAIILTCILALTVLYSYNPYTKDVVMSTYVDPEFNIQFNYPSDWRVIRVPYSSATVADTAASCEAHSDIIVPPWKKNITLQSFLGHDNFIEQTGVDVQDIINISAPNPWPHKVKVTNQYSSEKYLSKDPIVVVPIFARIPFSFTHKKETQSAFVTVLSSTQAHEGNARVNMDCLAYYGGAD